MAAVHFFFGANAAKVGSEPISPIVCIAANVSFLHERIKPRQNRTKDIPIDFELGPMIPLRSVTIGKALGEQINGRRIS